MGLCSARAATDCSAGLGADGALTGVVGAGCGRPRRGAGLAAALLAGALFLLTAPPAMTQTGSGTGRVVVSQPHLTVDEGGSATYTVGLSRQPDGLVTVHASSGDGRAAAVSPRLLSFGPTTWFATQTVTVRGVADTDLDNESVRITHTVAGYGGAAAPGVAVTVTDTGTGTDRVVVSTTAMTIGEDTRPATYTVRLDTRPRGTVKVAVSSSDRGVVVAIPSTLSFDAANWKVTQTVAVFGVADRDYDHESARISHKVSGYGSVTAAAAIAVSVLDPDGPVDVKLAPRRLVVDEGATATYTVTIDEEQFAPAANPLYVRASSGDLNVAAVAPDDLEFRYAAEQWKKTQTVTVRAAADTDLDDETVTITHSLFRFTAHRPDPYPGDSVTVVVTDTGTGTDRVAVSEKRLAIDEGDSATYTVRLDNRPDGSVTLWAAGGYENAVTVTPYRLAFDATTWKTAQTVTVRARADADLRDEAVQVTYSVYGYGDVTRAGPIAVAVTDTGSGTDRAVVSQSRLAVDEGGSVTYTLRLDSRPDGQVTITAGSADAGAATVFPRTLRFDTTNWKTPQQVTVRGVADRDIDDESVQVTHAVAGYGSVTGAAPVAVAVTDTGTGSAGVAVSASGLTVREGHRATYTVRLNTRPRGRVTVTATSNDAGAATVTPSSLTFAATNWRTLQTVTVRGVADRDTDRESVQVTHAVSGYGAVTVADPVAVTVTDPGASVEVMFAPRTVTVDEGGTATYIATVNPSTPVIQDTTGALTVRPASRDTGAVVVDMDPQDLTFRPGGAHWKASQTITVRGVADTDLDDETVTITHGLTLSPTGGGRNPYSGVPVTVVVTDTGTGTDAVVVSPQRLAVDEDGTATYTVRLDTRPGGTVTVTPTSGDPAAVTATPRSLIFDATNWKTPQPVTVQGVADTDLDDETGVRITHSVSGYGGVTAADPVAVTVTDTGTGTAGVTITPRNQTVDEGTGVTFPFYTVRLDTRPDRDVTIRLEESSLSGRFGATACRNCTQLYVQGLRSNRVTFTAANWKTPQDVAVRVAQDTDIYDRTVYVTHRPDAHYYRGQIRATVHVTDTGTGTAGVTITPASLSVDEGADATYTVRLDTRPGGTVTVQPASGDGGAVTAAPGSLTFRAANWRNAQTVTVRGVRDRDIADETAVQVTHTVSGYPGVTAADPVAVTVTDTGTGSNDMKFDPLSQIVDEGVDATYTIRLTNRPAGDVNVRLTCGGCRSENDPPTWVGGCARPS